MEEEFFNIDFNDASSLGILDLPNNEPPADETKDKTDETNKVVTDAPQEEEATEEVDNKREENSTEVNVEGSPNISSSIALALAENGVLQTLDKERLEKVVTTENLIEAFREELKNRLSSELTEQQKRVLDALDNGVEKDEIKQYESIIEALDGVTDKNIEAEGAQYENYRKNLIYQDYINKGFEEDDAREMVDRSVESGNDINDAKKALSSLKKFYKNGYDAKIQARKKEVKKFEDSQRQQIEQLRVSILDDDEFYNKFDINKSIRQKIFDTVAKPIKQEDNTQLTAIQEYMKNKPNEALKMFGTMYVLTEGFTKFENILKSAVKRQVSANTKKLEALLSQTPSIDGSLEYKSGIGDILNSKETIVGFDI